MTKKDFDKYLETYHGKELLKKYSLDDCGIWVCFGEDPNCDLGGHHHEPFLFARKGTLKEAIKKGVKDKRFWQWGAGGRFILQETENGNEKPKDTTEMDQQQEYAKILHDVANSYTEKSGNAEWINGANWVFRQFAIRMFKGDD